MSNPGNFSVGLTEVIKWSDATYSIGRLLVLFIIVFGLLYYLGKLSRETHKLKRPSRFETDLRNYAEGLVFLIVLLSMAAVIATYFTSGILDRLDSTVSIFFLLGSIESALIVLIIPSIYTKFLEGENKTKTFWKPLRVFMRYVSFGVVIGLICALLMIIVPVLIVVFASSYQQQIFYLSILIVFLLLVGYPFLSGRFSQPPEHKVSVYLSGSNEPLEDMVLYQTTEVDYRFKKGDAEIVIPISKVQKIVYKTSQKETSQTAPSDERVTI